MKNIAILGIDGMLGSAVAKVFKEELYNVIAVNRTIIDAQTATVNEIKNKLGNCEYIINCIGIIKPYIHDNNPLEIERAIMVNALFPHILAQSGIKIIQIATDCVFDGVKGNYLETDMHNAIDVYGKTKSLGEITADNFLNLRCSIIGPEKKNRLSLLEWFINQPKNASVNGYLNHHWNGITTYAFANICKGIIDNDLWFSGLQHIIPANILNKSDMLKIFAKTFSRTDISITDINANESIDRTINTINVERNRSIWESTGYKQLPTIEYMINQLKEYE